MPRLLLIWAMAGLVCLAFPLSGRADENPSGRSSESSGSQGSEMVISAPTMPFVPPILPSFYNDPQFAERELGGRSLNYVFAVCGDGVYDPGEQCDDGNRDSEDGCSDLCRLEDLLACGDGKRGPGETCDDGNLLDGDGCSGTCQSEGACGDGNLDAGEECDDGNLSSGDGCSQRCFSEAAQPQEQVERPIEPEPQPPQIVQEVKKEVHTQQPIKQFEEIVEETEDEVRVTRYIQGRGITTPSECTATCTMARVYVNDQLEQEFEVVSERRVTGGTYSTAFGEVNCVTGQIVGLSDSLSDASEVNASGETAQVTGCTA